MRQIKWKLLFILQLSALLCPPVFSSDENMENFLRERGKDFSSLGVRSNAVTPFLLDSLVAFKFGTVNGSGNWGYTAPDGQQYAIMGIHIGVIIVNATTLEITDTVTGVNCLWQEMKTYQHYLYSVSECGTGIKVIDLQYLPDSVHYIGAFPTSDQGTMSCHNISIDTVTGYMYAEGISGFGNNIFILNLANPELPAYVSRFGFYQNEIHDITANDDTLYVANGSAHTFSVLDASDKFNVQLISLVNIPNGGYVHNLWPSDDRKLVASTEETSEKTVKIWNIEDLQNIELVGEYLGPVDIAHNVYIIGDYLYLSHYSAGTRIVDIRIPSCPVEVAAYDPPPDNTWGCFPFTGVDSLVYASNMDGVMSILKLRRNPAYVLNDTDGDGIENVCDNCPTDANLSQIDSDQDGYGDICDNCPSTYNPAQTDTDADNVGEACDSCPDFDDNLDADSDDVPDGCDACPGFADSDDADGDDVPDGCDACTGSNDNLDIDGDNVPDGCDACPGFDDNIDSDADGIANGCDGCPNVFNPSQADTDSDGDQDSCDNCMALSNANQLDTDADGIGNVCDICPNHYNPGQEDLNNNGIGDACCCVGRSGDIDGSGNPSSNILDLTYLVNRIFRGGPIPPCAGEADLNLDSISGNILDLTFVVNYIFRGGAIPPLCP